MSYSPLISQSWGAFLLHAGACGECHPIERLIARGETTAEVAKTLGRECCGQGQPLYEAWLYAVSVAMLERQERDFGRRRTA